MTSTPSSPSPQEREKVCPNPAECCKELSRVWIALGLPKYDGRSCHEHVAALAAPPEGWQDMKSCPKDGRDVLLHGALGVGVGHWERDEIAQEDQNGQPAEPIPAGWWGERGYWPAEADLQPTHWHEIPDPPLASSSGETEP